MTDIDKYTTKEFWQNAPEGTTHRVLGNNTCSECWVKEIAGEFFYSYGSNNWKPWDNGHALKDIMIPKPKFDERWMPEIGSECEALLNSRSFSVNGETEYKRVKILSHDCCNVTVFRWLEGPRTGELGEYRMYAEKDCYGAALFRPIQTKAEESIKEPKTVPKWKFDCLVKELQFYQNKLVASNHLHNKIKMFVDKNVWFWENDGENHLESLACLVVIDADTLRKLIKNGG